VFTLKTSLTTNPSLSQLNNMWLDEQDCPRRKTLYDISQEDIVIDIPCFSQRLPIPFMLKFFHAQKNDMLNGG